MVGRSRMPFQCAEVIGGIVPLPASRSGCATRILPNRVGSPVARAGSAPWPDARRRGRALPVRARAAGRRPPAPLSSTSTNTSDMLTEVVGDCWNRAGIDSWPVVSTVHPVGAAAHGTQMRVTNWGCRVAAEIALRNSSTPRPIEIVPHHHDDPQQRQRGRVVGSAPRENVPRKSRWPRSDASPAPPIGRRCEVLGVSPAGCAAAGWAVAGWAALGDAGCVGAAGAEVAVLGGRTTRCRGDAHGRQSPRVRGLRHVDRAPATAIT